MPHKAASAIDERHFEDPEVALARHYCDEIRGLLTELWATLPSYRQGAGERTYHLVWENLGVLTDCFYTNALSAQALGVLRDHLWMLSRTVSYRIAEAKHRF